MVDLGRVRGQVDLAISKAIIVMVIMVALKMTSDDNGGNDDAIMELMCATKIKFVSLYNLIASLAFFIFSPLLLGRLFCIGCR